jgi:hypothetical protein
MDSPESTHSPSGTDTACDQQSCAGRFCNRQR